MTITSIDALETIQIILIFVIGYILIKGLINLFFANEIDCQCVQCVCDGIIHLN